MSISRTGPQILDFFGTPLVIEPSRGQLSSNAGLLPIRHFDQRIGRTRAFADALDAPRATTTTAAAIRERFDLWRIVRIGTFARNRHPG